MKAIIPFKKEGAKSRLRDLFSEREREELALRMLRDVLATLSKSEIEEAEIISTCSEEIMGELKSGFNQKPKLKLTLREDSRGLNEVLNEVLKEEKEPVLIIMADIPLATPESINEIVGHEEDVVIAPGRKGGTNALFLRRPSDFVVSYYGISCLEHIETAKRRNLSYVLHDSFFLSADIDEIDDLAELLIHGRGLSAEYLHQIGVFLRVDKNSKMQAKVDR
ncbi:MAG: 2-phospho-L-lactate guanylyltransferase [Methanophagales archaeon]|nr:2-phospho-L-lactate guanylyltransferase [Methanophagales archaeon]MCW3142127.1 2-phospho-L-lactate guanylyltransferase [Methanophagales archaeon]